MDQASLYTSRQDTLRQAMIRHNLDVIALNPGPTLTYLTGLHFHLMERPTVLLIPARNMPALILPTLEQAKTQTLLYPLQIFAFNDDPDSWAGVFIQATDAVGMRGQGTVGVEPTRWRFLEMSFLQAACPNAKFISAAPVLDLLRIYKDANEIAAIRQAVQIAERALLATLPAITPGISEAQVASELTVQLLKAGSQPELPFAPIVAAGENAANPHAVPTARPLRPGDLLIIDWGATCEGYISDLTRTFAIGRVDDELRQIAEIVLAANQAGRNAAAGASAGASAVDQAARQVIAAAGYGAYFIHRTGHGIGLEAHEPPYIRAGNEQTLLPGMTFTVEPGIYLPGRGGVRIEDNVLITPNGCETLSSLPRQLIVLH